jgi:RNA polymerase sigma factor (sigma-70 family)
MADTTAERDFWAEMLTRVRKRMRFSQDSEDHLHSAFVKLNQARESLHEIEKPKSYLVQAAANLAIDDHRKGRRIDGTPIETRIDIAAVEPLQDEVLASRERLRRVQEGIGKLAPRTREVFWLCRIEGMKQREVAVRLKISQTAVEQHLAKAMLFLTEWTKGW